MKYTKSQGSRLSFYLTAYVFLFIFLFGAVLFGGHCRKELPSEIPTYEVDLRKVDPTKIEISLKLPDFHHVYLDKGEKENYVPLIFRWGENKQNEFTELERETGIFDSELRVQVLRGQGTFLVMHERMKDIKEILIRAQICDEKTSICYRPIWTTHSLDI